MYSMMLAWLLVQVIFLLRARGLGGMANYVGLTLFSAFALATNFTAGLVIVAEALWLIYLRLSYTQTDDRARAATSWKMGVALAAALLLLLPFFAGLQYGVEGVTRGDYAWMQPPGLWEPLATFDSGRGNLPLTLFALFA